MNKIIKFILIKISRILFWITPEEFKLKQNKNKLKLILDNNLLKETFETFGEHIKKSVLFGIERKQFSQIRKYAIQNALLNDTNNENYYLEFGTWNGASANFISKYVKKLYAFDSFQGLKEDWKGSGKLKGTFDLQKKLPKLNSNVEPIVGWVEDTLDDFLKKHNPKINFVHLDMDLYAPTKYTLKKLKPYLKKNAIILFDDLYNYYGWEYGEYKALKEVFKDDEYTYKAFNLISRQSVIQIN